jgi:bifunctional cystathionine gamma-lyase/maltose regulon repressor
MWVADMEIKTPKEIIEALKKRIEHGVLAILILMMNIIILL